MTDREKQLEEMLRKMLDCRMITDMWRHVEEAKKLLEDNKPRYPAVHDEKWEVDDSEEHPGITTQVLSQDTEACQVVWTGNVSDYGGVRGRDETHALERVYLMAAAPKMKRALLLVAKHDPAFLSGEAQQRIQDALTASNPPAKGDTND